MEEKKEQEQLEELLSENHCIPTRNSLSSSTFIKGMTGELDHGRVLKKWIDRGMCSNIEERPTHLQLQYNDELKLAYLLDNTDLLLDTLTPTIREHEKNFYLLSVKKMFNKLYCRNFVNFSTMLGPASLFYYNNLFGFSNEVKLEWEGISAGSVLYSKHVLYTDQLTKDEDIQRETDSLANDLAEEINSRVVKDIRSNCVSISELNVNEPLREMAKSEYCKNIVLLTKDIKNIQLFLNELPYYVTQKIKVFESSQMDENEVLCCLCPKSVFNNKYVMTMYIPFIPITNAKIKTSDDHICKYSQVMARYNVKLLPLTHKSYFKFEISSKSSEDKY